MIKLNNQAGATGKERKILSPNLAAREAKQTGRDPVWVHGKLDSQTGQRKTYRVLENLPRKARMEYKPQKELAKNERTIGLIRS